MQPGALSPYEDALQRGGPLHMHSPAGDVTVLEIERWLAPADAVDRAVLDGCRGPVLDVGCGPGRLVEVLHERGVITLGIDIAEVAIELANARGGPAEQRDVFAPLPHERDWASVLLLDGNIGIGGDPRRLLVRVADLLAPGGEVVVETDPDDAVDVRECVRFARNLIAAGPEFSWARVGLHALTAHAQAAGLDVLSVRRLRGRTFAALGHRLP